MTIIREHKNVGILSGEERRDHKLSFFERVLLCEVRFLTNNDSGNAKVDFEQLANEYKVTIDEMISGIENLKIQGYIEGYDLYE